MDTSHYSEEDCYAEKDLRIFMEIKETNLYKLNMLKDLKRKLWQHAMHVLWGSKNWGLEEGGGVVFTIV